MRVNFQCNCHQAYTNYAYIKMHFDDIESFFISEGSVSATIKFVCSHSLFKNEFRQCIQCVILRIFTNIVIQNNIITNNMFA